MTKHPIPPVFNESSRILILGSFPSVRSREECFFYAHGQNRFWKVLSAIYDTEIPKDTEKKRAFLLDNGIALWDVIASCNIVGSSDSSITDVVPNDLSQILNTAPIEKIFVNGKTAKKYYDIYIRDASNREAVCLPSTSPANATWSLERLIEAWRVIK